MTKEVEQYIAQATPTQQPILEQLCQLIKKAVPTATESIKWSRPVFTAQKDFVYLKTAKAYVTLGFFSSQNLNDPNGLLEGTGKDMRHIKIRKVEDIDSQQITEWLKVLANIQ